VGAYNLFYFKVYKNSSIMDNRNETKMKIVSFLTQDIGLLDREEICSI